MRSVRVAAGTSRRRCRRGPVPWDLHGAGRAATLLVTAAAWRRTPRNRWRREHCLDAIAAAQMYCIRTSCKLYGHVGIIGRVERELEVVLVAGRCHVLDASNLLDVVHEHVLHSIC